MKQQSIQNRLSTYLQERKYISSLNFTNTVSHFTENLEFILLQKA